MITNNSFALLLLDIHTTFLQNFKKIGDIEFFHLVHLAYFAPYPNTSREFRKKMWNLRKVRKFHIFSIFRRRAPKSGKYDCGYYNFWVGGNGSALRALTFCSIYIYMYTSGSRRASRASTR